MAVHTEGAVDANAAARTPVRDGRLLGILAALTAISIWAGWQIATRHSASTSLTPFDLAFLRYGVASLLLAPVLLRNGLLPRKANPWTIAAMVAGAGLPFGLVAMAGARLAPVAHMGAIMPTTVPMFVMLLGALWFGERATRVHLVGFALILAGVAAIIGPSLGDAAGSWRGDLLFVCGGALWAVYTFGIRQSGLTGWQAAAVLNAWSFLLLLPIWYLSGDSGFLTAPWQELAMQVLWQGVLSGVVGIAAYSLAVRRLGVTVAAAFSALVPAMSSFGGMLLLGERLTPLAIGALVLVTAGFLFASGAVGALAGVGRRRG
ncbi:EamA-like transporter family [Chelatococcus sambhunathii]|uniref:EamA-like transporter family n=1 Tax=Chelatococcus sambhunathii TaxID=363953 RepID=A0ABM9U233_9HYPH|nr:MULTISPECIES: DMT family transporter [Chelatococcus]CUA84595.1 EamA-like transporter family [Chelatococcus sambhunathii]